MSLELCRLLDPTWASKCFKNPILKRWLGAPWGNLAHVEAILEDLEAMLYSHGTNLEPSLCKKLQEASKTAPQTDFGAILPFFQTELRESHLISKSRLFSESCVRTGIEIGQSVGLTNRMFWGGEGYLTKRKLLCNRTAAIVFRLLRTISYHDWKPRPD